MISDLSAFQTTELRALLSQSRQTLSSLAESVQYRTDMHSVIRSLMSRDGMLESFTELVTTEPDLMRLVLQASVATLVNFQTLHALDSEIKRRAAPGN